MQIHLYLRVESYRGAISVLVPEFDFTDSLREDMIHLLLIPPFQCSCTLKKQERPLYEAE